MSDEDEILSDEDVELLRREIQEIKNKDLQLQLEIMQSNQAVAPLKKEEEKLRLQINEAVAKRRTAEAAADTARKDRKRLDHLRDERERKLRKFMSDKAIEEQREKFDYELEMLAATKFWHNGILPHQLDGAKRLAGSKRAILGDVRGLGKTLTSIAWLDLSSAKKTIIFTPTDVSQNFMREINRWAPDRPVLVTTGMNAVQRNVMFEMASHAEEITIIMNYEAWRKDPTMVQRLIDIRFDTMILDEAHNIKNIKGVAFEGIKEIVYAENQCPECKTAARIEVIDKGFQSSSRCTNCLYVKQNMDDFCSIKNILPMSGTTILNRPQDIWPLLYLLDRQQFRNVNDFLRDYAYRDYSSGRWTFAFGGQERLLRRIGDGRFIRRTPETAGVTFPPQERVIHKIEFDKSLYPRQWEVLQQIKNFGAIRMADDVALNITAVLAEITRRRQAICWPGGIFIRDKNTNEILYRSEARESVKIDKAVELIREITEQEEDRVVLFCTFTEALKELEDRLNSEGISCVRYDGSTSDSTRNEIQLDFDIKTASKTDYRWKVVLAQYQSASTGLNFTGARQMILLDRYWSPGRESQAEGRIQRLDSVDSSIVHVLEVAGSIDDWMDQLIEYKREDIEGMEGIVDKEEFSHFMKRLMTDEDTI